MACISVPKAQTDVFSKNDLVLILDFVHSCAKCNNEETYTGLMLELRCLMPHELAATGMANIGGIGINGSYNIVNVDYPIEWMQLYEKRKYILVDPIIKANFTQFTPLNWGDVYKQINPPKDFLRLATDFSLDAGYAYGVRNLSCTKGSIFSFSGKGVEYNARSVAILMHVVPHLHIALERVLRQRQTCSCILSEREKEVLRWSVSGKSSWDISAILGISERTVYYHIGNIMQKLDEVNRSHAVAIALDQGFLGEIS